MGASPRSNSQRGVPVSRNSCTIVHPMKTCTPETSNRWPHARTQSSSASGPNGLCAAIALAQAGRKVIVFEADGTIGGGARRRALTLPGFVHDVCSAVHPFGDRVAVLADAAARRHGLEWIQPPAMVAHPLDDAAGGDRVAIARRNASQGSAATGRVPQDRRSGRRDWPTFSKPLCSAHRAAATSVRAGAVRVAALSGRPTSLAARFPAERARRAASAASLRTACCRSTDLPTGAVALDVRARWRTSRDGRSRVAARSGCPTRLRRYLRSLGGEIVTGTRVTNIDDLPPARAVLCDLVAAAASANRGPPVSCVVSALA